MICLARTIISPRNVCITEQFCKPLDALMKVLRTLDAENW
jgi:hypothetical protein